MSVDVQAILFEFGITPSRQTPEFFEVKCPFHDDTNPSGSIHHKTGSFHCWVCKKKSTLLAFLQRYSNLPLPQVKSKVGIRSDCKKPIDPQEIERYHAAIWSHPTFLDELHKRCITDEDIRKYRLGVKDLGAEKRITIPIMNDVGECANLRMYIPGAANRKFLNTKGHSEIRLFPIEQLEYDQVLVVGGECKAIAGARVLNQHDIGCITLTCGEEAWDGTLTERFANKLVYVVGDDDDVGRRSAELRCRLLKPVVRELHKVELNTGVEKGDINNFLAAGGDLFQLLLKSPEWEFVPGGEILEELPESLNFKEAFNAKNVGKRIKFVGIVSGINNNSFISPAEVAVICNRQEAFCANCDVNSQAYVGFETPMKISPEHPSILGIIGEKTDDHSKILKEALRIPSPCRQCRFKAISNYSVTEVRLEEQVDALSREDAMTGRIGYIIDSQTAVDNQTYELIGRLYPFPRNQVACFLASQIKPTEDALDAYEPPLASQLSLFQPSEWTLESLKEKLNDIYSDIEANVTNVWRRREYHIAVDLAYHSVLHFDLGNYSGLNGWVELLVVGDTSQAKSTALERMQNHYGLGAKVDSKNVTLPGLTIGLQQGHTRHFSTLGVLPRNDKKLVIFEELKGMKPGVWQSLTEVRSSGYVQITKIESKKRKARVRKICLSNPPNNREVSSYTYGIESAVDIIGTNEDLRRFDLIMIISKLDLPETGLPELENPPEYPHKYTSEYCQQLILKAWKCENIIIEDPHYVMHETRRLLDIYGDGPPILDPNSSHIKIAKLATALAARTCSYDEEERLIVRKCHVDFIVEFLHKNYSSPACRLQEKCNAIKNANRIRGKKELVAYIRGLANAPAICTKLLEADTLSNSFIRDLIGDFYTGCMFFSKLIQSNALVKMKGENYAKTSEFTQLLKSEKWDDDAPEYLEKY